VSTRTATDVTRCSALFTLVYASMGASGILGQPIASLTKDGLGLSAGQSALFMALASAPTYLAPMYAFLSDAVPLLGARRRSYLLLGGLAGAVAWWCLGGVRTPTYALALACLAAGLVAMDLATTVANGLMVEEGKPRGLTGVFQSIQWGAANAASLVTTLVSGYLLAWFGGQAVFRWYALCPLLVAVAAAVVVREPRRRRDADALPRAAADLRAAASTPQQWALAAFVFAWFFSPGLGAALYYCQRDVLHFDPGFIGVLGAVFQGAGIGAALLYNRVSRRQRMRRLLCAAVALGATGHMAYLLLSSRAAALAVYALDGTLSMFAMLAVFDLAARAAPDGIEGTAFSVVRTARVVATLSGGVLGGWLYETVGLQALIAISAGFTLACGLFVPLLPCAEDGAARRQVAATPVAT